YDLCINHFKNAYGQINWPITFINTDTCTDNTLTGIQIYAVSFVSVNTIFIDNKPAARIFEDDFAKYCIIGNIFTLQEEQTWDILINFEKILNLVDMEISDIVRTWFYNHNIISWYSDFNSIRNNFFKQKGIINKILPVSTGVGGNNSVNAAAIASAIAIKAKKNNCVIIKELSSPLQNHPSIYGSLFSRALEIIMPDHRKILISGTASIDKNGKTIHVNNIDMQIAFTMDVIKAILTSRNMNFSFVTRAIVYFKYSKDISAFNKYCKLEKIPVFPLIAIQNDICRDNLLFEIEVDAINKKI
ncbi:MAG: hypothetical protein HY934_10020, partial [Candidatus Firestonebacteria bacterium]|nr:hypothetical protein [Candidatus Firestonebacteria bacterium]